MRSYLQVQYLYGLMFLSQVTGIDGSYRMTCASVMEVLRRHKDSVMAVLEAFVYDPLLNWRLLDSTCLHSTKPLLLYTMLGLTEPLYSIRYFSLLISGWLLYNYLVSFPISFVTLQPQRFVLSVSTTSHHIVSEAFYIPSVAEFSAV